MIRFEDKPDPGKGAKRPVAASASRETAPAADAAPEPSAARPAKVSRRKAK